MGKSPKPSDGRSYVGMVTRYNDTWEGISQKLTNPLMKDSCYEVSIDLCRGKEYASPTNRSREKREDFTEPVVLRVWLSNQPFEADQLVHKSDAIDYPEWKTNTFQIQPDQDYKYIHLQCFYHVPVLYPYNGHIMMDNMSHLVRVRCE